MNNKIERLKLLTKLLKTKNYEEIYKEFGSNIYQLFVSKKYAKEDIKILTDNKDYYNLIKKYGLNNSCTKKTTNNYFKELLNDGKYMDIINIYGYDFYEQKKYKIIKSGIKYETNSKIKGLTAVLKERVKETIIYTLKESAYFILFINILIAYLRMYTLNDSINKKKDLLDKYNKRIDTYVEEFKELELDNDLDIVMKIMDDMWKEIDGYGPPECEALGLCRIAFTEENKPGVCRNLADDFSYRLNQINKEYDAGLLVVYIDNNYYDKSLVNNFSYANIPRRKASNYVEQEGTGEPKETFSDKTVGNHMVSTFKPLGKDYTLVVDPTNPSIGVINKGKVYMLSTIEGKGIEFRYMGQIGIDYIDSFGKVKFDLLKTVFLPISDSKMEEINELWGHDAQNKSLEKLREKY